MSAYDDLQRHVAEINDILNTINILNWDARTQMPAGGSQTRGYQLATLSKIAQERFSGDITAGLLDAAEAEVSKEDGDSYRARVVQQTRHYYGLVKRIPTDLLVRRATLAPVSEQVWHAAKQQNDFASFAPYLQEMVDLARQLADAIGYEEHPFDALVYEYEPAVTAAKLRNLFEELKAGLLPLLKRIVGSDQSVEHGLWQHEYSLDKQRAFALEIAERFGYDLTRGRLDVAPHPFEISFTRNDVRITTRYDKHYFPMALYGTLHETGHALYEQNIDPSLTRTALTTDFLGLYAVGGTSYGAHEASSRMWENLIGRSRHFWECHFSRAREYFPEQFADADPDVLYRAVNQVKPSLIRVEADEVTYNLHIMLRVELELGLLEGSLQVKDLPEAWNARMESYLGVVPPDDSQGVLQDIHWSTGGFGSFPGYTVGNIMSAQLLAAAYRDHPELDAHVARGEYHQLLAWLTENFYQHGRAYNISELLQRATGADLQIGPYLQYLESKFDELY